MTKHGNVLMCNLIIFIYHIDVVYACPSWYLTQISKKKEIKWFEKPISRIFNFIYLNIIQKSIETVLSQVNDNL